MEEPNPLKIFENDPSSVININDGKLPPQAIDLEEAVIGAMLIDEKGVDEVIEILIPEVFYKKSHQLIFESIERLFRNSEPIDLLTVSADLKKNKTLKNIGGEYYLIELSQKVSSLAIYFFAIFIINPLKAHIDTLTLASGLFLAPLVFHYSHLKYRQF